MYTSLWALKSIHSSYSWYHHSGLQGTLPGLCQLDTKPDAQREGSSTKESPPLTWPVFKSMGHFFDFQMMWDDTVERHGWAVILGCIGKVAEQAMGCVVV